MFHDKAAVIAEAMATDHKLDAVQVKASPFIDFLVGLLKQFLPMLLTCLPVAGKNPATQADIATAAMKNLNVFQRWHLKRVLRHAIGDSEMEGLLLGPLTTEIIKVGANATPPDVLQAINDLGV